MAPEFWVPFSFIFVQKIKQYEQNNNAKKCQ